MGPDQVVSREEFLTVVEHLLAVNQKQSKALALVIQSLVDADAFTIVQLEDISTRMEASSEYVAEKASHQKLVLFEEIHNIVERYRDRPSEGQ
jgi:hypothetical protein